MAGNDLFGILGAEDKFDGTNYPTWAYIMHHVLVANNLWNIVAGLDIRPQSVVSANFPVALGAGNATISSSSSTSALSPPTQEHVRWDGRDAQALALIVVSLERGIIPHIRSCKTSKDAWDTLASLYRIRSQARVDNLRKQLDDLKMDDGESMDAYLTKVNGLKEQLANIDEVVPDSQIVSATVNGLPDSYQGFATTWHLVAKCNPNHYTFDQLVTLLLQEEQSGAFGTHRKGTGKTTNTSGKPKNNAGSDANQNGEKKQKRCSYCRKLGHHISECWKHNESVMKQSSLVRTNGSSTCKKDDSTKVAHHDWAFDVTCQNNPSVQDSYMAADAFNTWYLSSGASKHITSCKKLFVSLINAPEGGIVTCANDVSYAVRGIGQVEITSVYGEPITLNDVLYVPDIKKNLISISAIATSGYRVVFDDCRCAVYDFRNGNTIVITGILSNGLYRLDTYEREIVKEAVAVDDSIIADTHLWHERLGHLNYGSLVYLHSQGMVVDLPKMHALSNHVCEGCLLGKMCRYSFPKDGSVGTAHKLHLVHSDVCGPMRTPSIGEYLCFVVFVDDFTRHAWIYPLKSKSDVFLYFKHFLAMVENESGHKLAKLCMDRKGEYMSQEFADFLASRGIIHQCPMPHTPKQDGVAKHRIRTLMEMARCMIKGKSLPNRFWLDAIMCANYVLNRSPTKALKTITPCEAWTGCKPAISHMRVFGCLAYAHVPSQTWHELEDKAIKCIFIGYSSKNKGYRLYQPLTDKVIVSRDVFFAEGSVMPLLNCQKQPTVGTSDVFDTFLRLFKSASYFHERVDAQSQEHSDCQPDYPN